MDTPESLAAKLVEAGFGAIVGTRIIAQKSAQSIKADAKKNVEQTAPVHNAGAARTVTYRTEYTNTGVEAEIGYDRRVAKAAAIGNLLEYGGGGDHSPPHRDIGRASDDEEPRFRDALEALSRKLL